MKSTIRKRISEDPKIEEKSIVCRFPTNMLMELTNACNDSCLFCANSKSTRKKGMIDKELAKKVLEQAYKSGTREVGFYGTGEPLLDKNLEEYITYAKGLGYGYIYITTNGALLNEDRIESIIDSGIDSIKFSINASNPEDYLMIHGKDDFNRVMENLISLNSMRKKYKRQVSLYISYVLTRYTYKDKDNFQSMYGKYVDDIIFYDCLNTGGYMSNEITPYLSVNESKLLPVKGLCPMIFKNLYITYEGYLTMCCADFQNYLVIADLNQENLEEAWNNQYAQALRNRHLRHNLEGTLCFNCMNNCISNIKPLREEYGVMVDIKKWDKVEEIKERVERHSFTE